MITKTSNTNRQVRVLLLSGEIQRVEPNYRGLRVRSGRAWITVDGRDVVLKRGEEIALELRHDAAVVSALGHTPLVIELLGVTPRQPTVDSRLAVSAR
jgi:hypothetical protein